MQRLAHGEEADFEALYCQPSKKVDATQDIQSNTDTAFYANAC